MVLFLCDGGGDDPFAGRREGTLFCGATKIAPRRVCGLSRRGWEIPAFFVIGNVTGPRGGVCKKMAIFNICVKYVSKI